MTLLDRAVFNTRWAYFVPNTTPTMLKLVQPPSLLPVDLHRSAIASQAISISSRPHQLSSNNKQQQINVLILVAETGSGKTTRLPQFLIDDAKLRRVAVTQPRVIAAITVAKRVASERNCLLGDEVGYRVRFDDCSKSTSALIYMTDGILLREAMLDVRLDEYNAIVLDEAHERSLNTDILFGVVKRALKLRPDLFVVVMSATMDTARFSSFFPHSKVLTIEGRQFPVEILYTTIALPDRITSCVATIMQLHNEHELGDVLVFLSGRDEIESCTRLLAKYAPPELLIRPLYASLPPSVCFFCSNLRRGIEFGFFLVLFLD